MTQYTIGVDISKAHLDAHRLPDGIARQFTNDRPGFSAMIKWIGNLDIERIVYEPTGIYHRHFEDALAKAGLPLAKVNPLQARRFAEARGTRAKTDKVDAAVLAHMGIALQPGICTPPSGMLRDLKELQVARQALIKDRTAAGNRSKSLRMTILKKQSNLRLRQIERSLEQKAVASLAGLAPFSRESGKWKGKRFIGGGRKFLRDALYMPALVACTYNPDMKVVYQRLKGAGKPSKVAITAVMRKLIILANTLVKNNRMWEEIRT